MASALFQNEERSALIDSLETMLRPLIPVLLRHGVTLQDAEDTLRVLYVNELSARSKAQGRQLTDSRLGMLAGINRGEIQKLLDARAEREKMRKESARLIEQTSKVLAVWNSNKRFITPYGAALDLSLTEEEGYRTFDELLQVAAPEADPKVLLELMGTTDSVEIHSGRFVRCTNRMMKVGSERLAQIGRIGLQCGALAATAVHNLSAEEGDSLLEVRVETTVPLTPSFVSDLNNFVREKSTSFLEECDTWISERESIFADQHGRKFGLGLFLFEN